MFNWLITWSSSTLQRTFLEIQISYHQAISLYRLKIYQITSSRLSRLKMAQVLLNRYKDYKMLSKSFSIIVLNVVSKSLQYSAYFHHQIFLIVQLRHKRQDLWFKMRGSSDCSKVWIFLIWKDFTIQYWVSLKENKYLKGLNLNPYLWNSLRTMHSSCLASIDLFPQNFDLKRRLLELLISKLTCSVSKRSIHRTILSTLPSSSRQNHHLGLAQTST